MKAEFIIHSEKKHSVRYSNEELNMTVYMPKDVLKELTTDGMPDKLQITIEVK